MFIGVSLLVFHLILLHGAKGITRGTLAYLGDCINEGIFLKYYYVKVYVKYFPKKLF
jgi:hypothetical protein